MVAKTNTKTKSLNEQLPQLLKRRGWTLAELAEETGQSKRGLLAAIYALRERGLLIEQYGDQYRLETVPASPAAVSAYTSRPDHTFLFGFCGDTHLGSKYARLDVLEDLYGKFAAAKVDRVFHAGNWIDGEAKFNRYDLCVYGMDAQIDYLVKHYPAEKGITTYAIAGDDHEGWYGQAQGIDIGKHAEQQFREAGRKDWAHLGYVEAYVALKNAQTGKAAQLLLQHPGGGSAYALSYTSQKIVESFEGGEKPAVLLSGHYHKMLFANIRNVWCIQTGCTQDQTIFMRKKRLEAHVGGGICKLTQDAKTGAIVACQVEFFRYFNRGYYSGRWSHGGAVRLPVRV